MSFATLNAHSIISGILTLPRVGLWQAALFVDTREAVFGAATLDWCGLTLKGTVISGSIERGEYHCRIVGGAGGLNTPVQPHGFLRPNVQTVLSAIADDAGERLSGTIQPPVLNRQLDFFALMGRQTAALALCRLSDALEMAWRLLPDGTLWVGEEAWRPCAADSDPGAIEALDLNGLSRRLACRLSSAADAMPGETFGGERIDRVEHILTDSGFSSSLYFGGVSDGSGALSVEQEM
jgi:hypothetical protein